MATPRNNYLYGDSTESPLKTNFLEFLRDSIDFSVAALKSDLRIKEVRARATSLRSEADRQSAALGLFVKTVTAAIEGAPKEPDSPTMQCAAHLTSLAADAQRTFMNVIEAKLQADLAQAEADERAARHAAAKALANLLAPHDPPDATSALHLVLGTGGTYEGTSEGKWNALGLAWSLSLSVPDGHAWSQPVRVDRVVPFMEIQIPQASGWLSKGVKYAPQRIERHTITEFSNLGGGRAFKLRIEGPVETGFDVTLDASGGLKVHRLAPEATASGDMDVHADDQTKWVDLAHKIEATLTGLQGADLTSATVQGQSFLAIETFQSFVEQLVGNLAPTTRTIAERSLMPTELVIRKLLGNDRREEIFVAKAALREKYTPLPESLRSLFAPLGLEVVQMPSKLPEGVALRAELAPSRPPPPPMMSAPPSGEGLKPTMKRILGLAKSGDPDAAYREYATLFQSASFAENKPEDRRAALRLLVMTKVAQPISSALREAYNAALPRLKELADATGEQLDQDLLAACQAALAGNASRSISPN